MIGLDALIANRNVARVAVVDDVLSLVSIAQQRLVYGNLLAVLSQFLQADDFVCLEATHIMVSGIAVGAQKMVAGATAGSGHLLRGAASAMQVR